MHSRHRLRLAHLAPSFCCIQAMSPVASRVSGPASKMRLPSSRYWKWCWTDSRLAQANPATRLCELHMHRCRCLLSHCRKALNPCHLPQKHDWAAQPAPGTLMHCHAPLQALKTPVHSACRYLLCCSSCHPSILPECTVLLERILPAQMWVASLRGQPLIRAVGPNSDQT